MVRHRLAPRAQYPAWVSIPMGRFEFAGAKATASPALFGAAPRAGPRDYVVQAAQQRPKSKPPAALRLGADDTCHCLPAESAPSRGV
jgi:hypothetical protein